MVEIDESTQNQIVEILKDWAIIFRNNDIKIPE